MHLKHTIHCPASETLVVSDGVSLNMFDREFQQLLATETSIIDFVSDTRHFFVTDTAVCYMACSLDDVLDEALVVRKQSVGCRDTEIGKLANTTASPGRPAMTSPLNQENYHDLDIGKCQKRTMTAPATIINVEQSQLSMPDADVRLFC
jgi:hypothetical protein